jgi:hypothetical protein
MRKRSMLIAGGAVLLTLSFSVISTNEAYAICFGNCGTASGADGVVTAPPSGGTYGWISTLGGLGGFGQISGVGGTNGSSQSITFTTTGPATLTYHYNYVTSDGAGFADYAWSELLNVTNTHVAWLFTARTTPSGDTVPGQDMPAVDATLTPGNAPINPGAPIWSPLGGDGSSPDGFNNRSSGACWATGCGYTGWIKSEFDIASAGTYTILFGVTNWDDQDFDSGLAFGGITVGDVDIPIPGQVPIPAALPLFASGLAGLGWLARRRKKSQAAA